MKAAVRAAMVSALRDALYSEGSWAGETHIQKSTFFLQEATGVPLGYEFILYKYGPFSFDLRDDLSAFRADGLIALRPQAPYGPRLETTDRGHALQARFPKTLDKFSTQVQMVATFIGARGIGELERLGTALLLIRKYPSWDAGEWAAEMCKLKPHVAEPYALQAVSEVVDFLQRVVSGVTIADTAVR